MSLIVRGRLDGSDDRPVILELDQDRRWWLLTNASDGKTLLSALVRRDDQIIATGDEILLRGQSITLDEGQTERLAEMVTALDIVTSALRRGIGRATSVGPRTASTSVEARTAAAGRATAFTNSAGTTLDLASAVMVGTGALGALGVRHDRLVRQDKDPVPDGEG